MKTITFFLLILIGGCQSSRAILDVSLSIEKGSYLLEANIHASRDTTVIIDMKAFSYSCRQPEKFSLVEINRISLKHDQVVIEDQNRRLRMYSDMYFDLDEEKIIPVDNCAWDWKKEIKIGEKDYPHIRIHIPYVSDLKVDSKTKKIRLYYIFSNSASKPKYFVSNWVHLPSLTND